MLEFLKDLDKNSFYEFYQKSELGEFIKTIAPYINKRSYFKIENNGNITKKRFNYALPLLAVINKENEKEIIEYIYDNCIDYTETVNITKIDRLSNFEIEKLKKNMFKIFFNRDRSFALRYCKELYLRDEKEFYSSLSRYVLMNDVTSDKALMLQVFEELAKKIKNKSDIDYLLFCVIDYIVNYETNLYEYHNSNSDTSIEIDEIKLTSLNLKSYYKIIKNLEKLTNENVSRFKAILLKKSEKEFNLRKDLAYDEIAENILLNNLDKGE